MSYLLDTNAMSDLMKRPDGRVRDHIEALMPDRLLTSVIVVAELRYGIQKVRSERLARLLDGVLRYMTVAALTEDIAEHYASVRDALERGGTPIGQNDLLIAAHALALDVVLVTDNEKEFSRVPNLRIENWLRG